MSAPTQEQRDQAGRLGRLAGRARKPVKDCPYNANGSDEERVLAAVWVRGWMATNPDAGKDISYDG